MSAFSKPCILIVDDSEMNRAILTEMLDTEYSIIEAENGKQAVETLEKYGTDISLVLLDIVMPELDGFGVLTIMNQRGWIQDIPVIMISAEDRSDFIVQAYEMGVTDFIGKPFDVSVVHHRVINTSLLYAKQKRLIAMVEEQVRENTKQSSLMIDILSHIVEFRNGESGLHVVHIRTLTDLFLHHLVKTGRCSYSPKEIALISTASALHDIGKISIPSRILNKPGKLTNEEFDIMKTHTSIGATMLEGIGVHQDDPLVHTAYEICRWHHERYDGRGYPDGLKGDQIPLPAQVVALADVYDALTSERVYKPPFSHEQAVQMIVNGECGAFSPAIIQCLQELADTVRTSLAASGADPDATDSQTSLQNIADEMLRREELAASEDTRELLERERRKGELLAAMSGEIQFEYTTDPPTLTLSPLGMERFELPAVVVDPLSDPRVLPLLPDPVNGIKPLAELHQAIAAHHPIGVVEHTFLLPYPKGPRWTRLTCQGAWLPDGTFTGLVGKLTDVHDEKTRVDTLERLASLDPLTNILNRGRGEYIIQRLLSARPAESFAFLMMDLNDFKQINDVHGHQFGDKALILTAKSLHKLGGPGSVVCRFGGDEFIVFTPCPPEKLPQLEEALHSLELVCDGIPLTLSVGIALAPQMGSKFDTLFNYADRALYAIKRTNVEGNRVAIYDPSMQDMFSAEE